MRKILVTGAAGFIGFHLARRLLQKGETVVGLDNLNPYYDVTLKEARLALLEKNGAFRFVRADVADRKAMAALFESERFDIVVHLAAQAGVRYSLENPHAYVESNLVGFMNVLEGCRHRDVRHLIFASSSSVYGANTRTPFSVHDNVDHPLSLYAATKKANELMAHTYASLYGLPCTGLRFFTVYGPWGRPDMALFLFTRAILEGRPIDVFNEGRMERDFTYIDDIVEGVARIMERIPAPDAAWNGAHPDPAISFAPYRLYNIGNNRPVALMDFIAILEGHLGREAKKNFLPMQAGDVPATFADVDDLMADADFKPATPIEEGIGRFVAWYREYYRK
ncbi:MAG: capsular biosynthesis protein CpsI [Syntrophus sp. GWC2_56_31]|nr:MAG: capsular biosynthesis protein CpsI [Syntrophus sp. GWC2_56_31]